jgi:DNA-binding transcriptional LysR family regulator
MKPLTHPTPTHSRTPPPDTLPDWSDLRYFLEVARTGSHAGAARRLDVEHTTVARRLQRLTEQLGRPLFERSRAGLTLTAAGQVLRGHAEAMEAQLLTAAEQITGEAAAVAGTVRLAVPEALGTMVLAPRLPRLFAEHPELQVELLLLPRSPSLAAREADLAVMVEPPASGRYYVTRLTDLRYDLCASSGYLAAHPPVASLDDLAAHRFADYVQDYLLSDSLRYLDELQLKPRRVFAATGMLAQHAAIAAGIGLGMLTRYVQAADPTLRRVLPGQASVKRTLWLAAPSELFGLRRVRVVWDFLRSIAEGEPGLFGAQDIDA